MRREKRGESTVVPQISPADVFVLQVGQANFGK
jgi:hypothetical protein